MDKEQGAKMARWLLMLLVSGSLSIGIVATQEPLTREQQRPGTHGQSGTGRQSSAPTSLKGCLKQLGGNWVLAADTGQTISLVGDRSLLRPHDGRQIEVQGTLAGDGSFHVYSVKRISDSCTSQRASSLQVANTGQHGRPGAN
jgi:uncharacterized protein DUF5818